MVIRALDVVQQCYSNADGQKFYTLVFDYVKRGEEITISFEGVDSLPSSFVNSAFITLLDDFAFDRIKEVLSFTNTTPQINDMIKSRFAFEISRRAPTL